MASLIRRDPFEIPSMNRMFDRFFSEPFFSNSATLLAPVASAEEGTLAVDVSEDEKTVIVRASLPGFKKEDIHVEVNDGVLSIKAERSEEKEDKGENFYRKERFFGSVSRRIALPSTVTEAETRAELKDGVLTLRLPKSQKALPKKIAIN
jgi:HSP20 family protein